MESIKCWLTAPEYDVCPGVFDIPCLILLEKIDFSSLSRYKFSYKFLPQWLDFYSFIHFLFLSRRERKGIVLTVVERMWHVSFRQYNFLNYKGKEEGVPWIPPLPTFLPRSLTYCPGCNEQLVFFSWPPHFHKHILFAAGLLTIQAQ